MSERQDIDRLFQEKFKDFEATPSDKVWENIVREMNSTKKIHEPMLLPFWLKLCGVVVVFMIGLFVGSTFFFNTPKNQINTAGETPVTSREEKETKTTDSNQNNPDNITETVITNPDSNSLFAKEKDEKPKGIRDSKNQNTVAHHNNTNGITNAQHTHFQDHTYQTNKEEKQRTFHPGNSTATLAVLGSNTNHAVTPNRKNTVGFPTNNTRNIVSRVNSKKNVESELTAQNNDFNNSPNDANDSEVPIENNADFLFDNPNSKVAFEVGKEHYTAKKEHGIPLKNVISASDNTSNALSESLLAKDENPSRKSLSYNNPVFAPTDSLKMAKGKQMPTSKENVLEKKTEQEKAVTKQATTKNKWLVSAKATPIFMNASGNNSAIDKQFDNNKRNFQTTFSYGIGINYAVTNRLSVRTGIHSLNLKYTTDGIVYYQSREVRSIENIRRNETGSTIQIEDTDNRTIASSDGTIVTQKSSGAITQQMGYIEVPTEVSYKVVNKKFGIEVIGGLSTLFLTQNDVSLISAQRELKIGEASNLNNIHISSNIGLGFKYSFSKSLEANMEPMFKYQINTYRNNAGDFKPYYMGVYTGISYRF